MPHPFTFAYFPVHHPHTLLFDVI